MAKQINISVDDIKFDPEDELTPKLNKDTINYYFYINMDLAGTTGKSTGFKPVTIQLSTKVLENAKNVVRIIAKDHSLTQEGGEYV